MLSDSTQSEEFRRSEHWKSPLLNFQLRIPQQQGALTGDGPKYRSNSFSGNERNRLLLAGENGFSDVSLISGADSTRDGRSFATLDYDNDGWLDIALVSANAPRLQLFRNRMGELGRKGRAVSIRLAGDPEKGSNRDAVGAMVTATTSNGLRVYRRSIGEGLSSQNSAAIRITLAEGEELQKLSVRWPSGAVTEPAIDPNAASSLIEE